MDYIYKLKYKILEVFIKWLLRYYTMVFVIFGGGWRCAAYWCDTIPVGQFAGN